MHKCTNIHRLKSHRASVLSVMCSELNIYPTADSSSDDCSLNIYLYAHTQRHTHTRTQPASGNLLWKTALCFFLNERELKCLLRQFSFGLHLLLASLLHFLSLHSSVFFFFLLIFISGLLPTLKGHFLLLFMQIIYFLDRLREMKLDCFHACLTLNRLCVFTFK